ncbi:S1 RNA-binding domain-containing protein [Candidatus Woesearchaeota archaeon]|nr:S1 RNA-binding domain-containing protein [Candidatus Woesearchaeota archaeon]MBW3018020.1 S1 RNA-binding domain-containing protein [Candidatus Woesearchaeota archaeon]
MYYQREGLPEVSEIVLCTVTKIHHTSVFVTLDEYGNKSGMIHISEISPGRIRTIGDYVKEGKKIICKVLRIDRDRGHIDLSLRRVNEGKRREKTDQLKKEQKAEKTVDFIAEQLKIKPLELYNKLKPVVLEDYNFFHECFEDIVADQFDAAKFALDSKTTKVLLDTIKQRMKPAELEIKGSIEMITYKSDGVEQIKQTTKKMKHPQVVVKYLGGGKFNFIVKSTNYDEAEGLFEKYIQQVVEDFKKEGGEAKINRE